MITISGSSRSDDGSLLAPVTCEGTRGQPRQCIGGGHSGNLHQLVVWRPEGTSESRHSRDHGRSLIEFNGDWSGSGLANTVCCRAGQRDACCIFGQVGWRAPRGGCNSGVGIGYAPVCRDCASIPTIVADCAGNLRADYRGCGVDDLHRDLGAGLHRFPVSACVRGNAEEAVSMPGHTCERRRRSRGCRLE